MPRFAEGKVVAEVLGGELLQKIANPLIFNAGTVGGKLAPSVPIHGYDRRWYWLAVRADLEHQ